MVAGCVFYTAGWIVSNNIPSSPLTQWECTDAAPVFILGCNATIVMQDGCPKIGWMVWCGNGSSILSNATGIFVNVIDLQ